MTGRSPMCLLWRFQNIDHNRNWDVFPKDIYQRDTQDLFGNIRFSKLFFRLLSQIWIDEVEKKKHMIIHQNLQDQNNKLDATGLGVSNCHAAFDSCSARMMLPIQHHHSNYLAEFINLVVIVIVIDYVGYGIPNDNQSWTLDV